VSVAWISGLRRWVSVAAAASLAVTAAALFVALSAADGTRADSRLLSQRLVPVAAASARLLGQYTAQQTALRDYVTSGRRADLRPYTQAAGQIPREEAAVAALVRGDPGLPAQLTAAALAHRAWLDRVAGPQLRAAGQGNFAGARALQANILFTRPYTLAVRSSVTALQTRITSLQGTATARLVGGQKRLLAALLAVCVVVVAIAVGGVMVVRRWLLEPFTALREAAESVAAGRFGTRVPAVGPPELAELGRSTERMRTRLVAALADAAQAEVQLRWLFEASPNATLAVAADGSIVMVNEQARRMFGYTAAELAGRPVEVLVPAAARGTHPHKREGYLADPMTRTMGLGQQLSALRKDGQEFPVEVSLSSLPGESGVVAVVLDVSERLAAQAERERFAVRPTGRPASHPGRPRP